MINQMGKFSPNIAEISKPLLELLSVKRAWLWGPEQGHAFNALKQEQSPQYLHCTIQQPSQKCRLMLLLLV